MYEKTKYIILILFLIGTMLFSYDCFQNFSGNKIWGISELRITASIFIIILITIYFFLPKKFKQTQNKLTIGIIVITLFLLSFNINPVLKYYREFRFEKIMTEYKNTDCEKMSLKFDSDIEKNRLKLFISGGLYNTEVAKKHEIEIFNNGTYDLIIGVGKNLNCYNDLVEEYFLTEFAVDLKAELYKNITTENMN
ncbi:hypothetical protein GCM10022291_32700 [Postechiella marina]|uniref:Uncharacterized protein n=1 Tax=Postechiella marina TaxID=943941 RepID=A0ABP8CH98_9FLAO